MRRATSRAAGTGTVRMGVVSLLALVAMLALAVMAVLAVSTGRAAEALARRQASFTADDYANEAVAQELLARVSGVAAEVGADAVASELGDLVAELPEGGPAVTASMVGRSMIVHVESASGRCLNAVLEIGSDGLVSVASWRATTLWDEGTDDVLWTGEDSGVDGSAGGNANSSIGNQ